MSKLKLSKQWRIAQEDDQLHISGGQDSLYTIDLDDNKKSFFADIKSGQQFTKLELSNSDQIVLEQLISAGVIIPSMLVKKAGKPKISLIGQRSLIKGFDIDSFAFTQVNSSPDLIVFIRTNESLGEFLQKYNYTKITQPHLLLDLSFNHTISLGPLVYPGLTSCLACLEGRLKTRWGDSAPPLQPDSSVSLLKLATEWLNVELVKLFDSEEYFLINKTVTLDTQSRSMTSNKLLTVPLCRYCSENKLLSSGKIVYNSAKA